jgi:hypothetical protein
MDDLVDLSFQVAPPASQPNRPKGSSAFDYLASTSSALPARISPVATPAQLPATPTSAATSDRDAFSSLFGGGGAGTRAKGAENGLSMAERLAKSSHGALSQQDTGRSG